MSESIPPGGIWVNQGENAIPQELLVWLRRTLVAADPNAKVTYGRPGEWRELPVPKNVEPVAEFPMIAAASSKM